MLQNRSLVWIAMRTVKSPGMNSGDLDPAGAGVARRGIKAAGAEAEVMPSVRRGVLNLSPSPASRSYECSTPTGTVRSLLKR